MSHFFPGYSETNVPTYFLSVLNTDDISFCVYYNIIYVVLLHLLYFYYIYHVYRSTYAVFYYDYGISLYMCTDLFFQAMS